MRLQVQNKTILIIDNNIEFINEAISILSNDNDVSEVVWALTTEDIHEKIQNYNPSIIILDLGIKGGEHVQSFIKNSYTSPILLVTSFFENNEYLQLSKQIGADGFCLKENFKDAFMQLKEFMDKGISGLFTNNQFSLN